MVYSENFIVRQGFQLMGNIKPRRQHYGESLHGNDGYRTDNCQRKLRNDVRLYFTSSLQNSDFLVREVLS